jgi:hypothetical protein
MNAQLDYLLHVLKDSEKWHDGRHLPCFLFLLLSRKEM